MMSRMMNTNNVYSQTPFANQQNQIIGSLIVNEKQKKLFDQKNRMKSFDFVFNSKKEIKSLHKPENLLFLKKIKSIDYFQNVKFAKSKCQANLFQIEELISTMKNPEKNQNQSKTFIQTAVKRESFVIIHRFSGFYRSIFGINSAV